MESTARTVQDAAVLASDQKKRRFNWETHAAGYLFIAPLLAVFAVFFVYGFYFLIRTSFQEADISFYNPTFVGFRNYRLVLQDPQFYHALLNNLVFAAFTVLVSLTLGFAVSVFLQFRFRGSRFFQSIIFLPTLMPLALVATVFALMLEFKFGTLNTFLRLVGLDALAMQWLGDPNLAYGSVMFVSLYLIGLPVLYYSAEMTTLNGSVLEAAVLDGAGLGRISALMIYPLVKNAHKTILLSVMLGSFREFERIYLMTAGGPGGKTEIISTFIYSFTKRGQELGFASAASVLVLLIAFVIAFIQVRLYRNKR